MRRFVIKLTHCFLALTFVLGICSFPISSFASNDAITPLVVDPYPQRRKTQLNSLLSNKVKDEDGNWVTSGGVYHEEWAYYNCYAYAIRMPGESITAGFMSGGDYELSSATVQEVALLVKADLEALGYSNVQLHSEIPAINETQELICFRKTVLESDKTDFHYMRYDYDTNAWYHKPGETAVLKYNGVPSNDILWRHEVVDATGMWLYPDTKYGGEIIYITYTKNIINVGQTVSKSINPGKEILCEINVDTCGEYAFTLASVYSNNFYLYNADLDLLLEDSGTQNVAQIELSPGKYYLRVNLEDYDDSFSFVNITTMCIHTHSYQYTAIDGSTHRVVCDCDVNFVEEHDMQNGTCADCGYHVHSYTDHYQYKNALQHTCYCSCGAFITSPHVIRQSDGGNVTVSICLYCDAMISGPGVINGVYTDLPHTDNGSFILPNGIIVLAPEDEEAYLNGTLVFRTGEIQ